MKKLIFSAILLLSGVAFVHAQSPNQPQRIPTEQTPSSDEYKVVTMDELNAAVQAAIKALAGDAYDVKTVEFNDAAKRTRVTLVRKSDLSEKYVILDNEGKQV